MNHERLVFFFRMLRNFKKLTTPSWLDILLKYNDPHLDQVKDKARKAYQVSADEQTYGFLKFMRNVIRLHIYMRLD